MSNKLRIIIAEDHKTVREGIKLLVNAQDDMEVIGEAGDGEAVLVACVQVGSGYRPNGYFDAGTKWP